MPLHDWTDERGWDSIHPLWLTYLLEHVQERLPEGYKAFLGGVPSLTVDSGRGKPDVSVRQWGAGQAAEAVPGGAGGTGVLEPDLEASVAFRVGEDVPVADDVGSLVGLWRRPPRIGQPLPVLPLPLSVHRAVPVDLEATYHRAAKRAYLD